MGDFGSASIEEGLEGPDFSMEENYASLFARNLVIIRDNDRRVFAVRPADGFLGVVGCGYSVLPLVTQRLELIGPRMGRRVCSDRLMRSSRSWAWVYSKAALLFMGPKTSGVHPAAWPANLYWG